MLCGAAAEVRDKLRGGSDGALAWDAAEGWEAKLAACERLLRPHGGKVGVSEVEPLPDAHLTAM